MAGHRAKEFEGDRDRGSCEVGEHQRRVTLTVIAICVSIDLYVEVFRIFSRRSRPKWASVDCRDPGAIRRSSVGVGADGAATYRERCYKSINSSAWTAQSGIRRCTCSDATRRVVRPLVGGPELGAIQRIERGKDSDGISDRRHVASVEACVGLCSGGRSSWTGKCARCIRRLPRPQQQ